VGAGHAHALYVHGHSPIHGLAPEVKLAAGFAFVLGVAVTPREAVWAFAIDAVALGAVVAVSGLRVRFVAARLLVILPFIAFAFLIPFIASGERLGATVSILLAATTEVPRILRGLDRLRVPAPLTAIAGFMVRYIELIAGDLARMRVSMTARGYDPRWLWQVRPIAASAGALFIRSYERGERVHAAMLARGYTGAMPVLDERTARAGEWLAAAVLPLVAAATASAALLMGYR
jgi:cobalt/nickel transport system permease protein